MRVQLCYRCRQCRQDELRDYPELKRHTPEALEYCLLNVVQQTVVHNCSPSHVGLCDLTGAVVTEE